MLPSVNKNSERKSNALPLPGSIFIVSFTYPNKQLFNVKSMFKFTNHGVSVKELYSFITLLGI